MRSYRGSVEKWQNRQADQSRDLICSDLILAILLVLTADHRSHASTNQNIFTYMPHFIEM